MANSVFTPEQEARINDLLIEYLAQNGASIDVGINVTELTGDALSDENLKKLTIPSILPTSNQWVFTSLQNMMAPITHAINEYNSDHATAVNDHDTALADHTQAISDHDNYTADRQTFADDEAQRQQTFEDNDEERMRMMVTTYCYVDIADMHLKFVTTDSNNTAYKVENGHLKIGVTYEE